VAHLHRPGRALREPDRRHPRTRKDPPCKAPRHRHPHRSSSTDVELHYVERGSGTPVVLVHGSLADYTYWEWSDQIPLLAEHHRVIAYSRRYNHPNRNPRGARPLADGRGA
jgi:hypothetical protein